jgi:hypothetical protein
VTDNKQVTVKGVNFLLEDIVFPVGDGSVTITARSVNVLVTGALASNPGVSGSAVSTVYVKNDLVQRIGP